MNKHVETLCLGAICTVFVLSMHQSCSNTTKKVEKTGIKKELKNNTVNKVLFNNSIRQR